MSGKLLAASRRRQGSRRTATSQLAGADAGAGPGAEGGAGAGKGRNVQSATRCALPMQRGGTARALPCERSAGNSRLPRRRQAQTLAKSMQAPLVRATWTASSQAQMLRVSEGEETKSASGLAPGLAIRLTSAPRGAAP